MHNIAIIFQNIPIHLLVTEICKLNVSAFQLELKFHKRNNEVFLKYLSVTC
jgi:hypothetical protein